MKTLLMIFICLITLQPINAQKLLWENEIEYELGAEAITQSLMPSIIDSDDNLVIFNSIYNIDGNTKKFTAHKYDNNGNLLNTREYIFPITVIPISIVEKSDGYDVLFATGDLGKAFFEVLKPMIVCFNKNFDTLKTLNHYADNENLSEYGFRPAYGILLGDNNTVVIDDFYYNATINEAVQINDTLWRDMKNMLVNSYNEEGKLNWRIGLDTLQIGDKSFAVRDIKKAKNGNLLILTNKLLANNEYQSELMRFNTSGELLEKATLPNLNDKWFYSSVVELSNNEYLLRGYSGGQSILKLDGNFEILNRFDFNNENILQIFAKMYINSNDELLFSGLSSNIPMNSILYKLFNSNLDSLSQNEFKESSSAKRIIDIKFINSREFYAIGYTAINTFYVAKYEMTHTSILEKAALNISLYPNPTPDILHIRTDELISRVELSDLLGNVVKVHTSDVLKTSDEFKSSDVLKTSDVLELNVENLPAGMYFLKLYTMRGEVLVEKVVVGF